MNAAVLAQSPWRNVHNYFNNGRSLSELPTILLAIAAIVGAVLLVNHMQHRRSAGHLDNDPRKLFRTALRQLPLSVFQRDLLQRIERDLSLDQPAVIFLSPQLFADHARAWIDRQTMTDSDGTAPPPAQLRELLDGVSHALFATGLPAPTESETVSPADTIPPSDR